MTSVNVSAVTNTVTVTENGSNTVVTVITAGPQGAAADLTALEARVAALEALNILLLEG